MTYYHNEGDLEVKRLMEDPSTPFWAIALMRDLLKRDVVDVADMLIVLAEAFHNRAQFFLNKPEVNDESPPEAPGC